jgi:DNA (cytosine-5)-methyltransferase 1
VEVPVWEDQAGAVHKARRTTEEGKGREVVKYLSVCSGIEAASVAWHPLGWQPVGFAEIEKFPSQVLAHRFPGVPNFGDMTKFKEWNLEPGTIDLLVGGTPCQAFSVAGLRKGLSDPRGNLALTFVAMVDHCRPEWVVWENVPGVLSSNGGRDFGAFLGALGQLGYGWAYRILDAQYFGVAQRRRRVFVVAHASGDPRRCASVLFEPESLCGDPPPSREAGQETTADPGASASGGGLWDTVGALCADTHPGAYSGQDAYTGRIIPSLYESHPNDSRVTGPVEQCPTVSARWGTDGNNTPLVTDGEASAFSWQCRGDMRGMVPRPTAQLQRCQIEAVMTEPAMHVRRLTPVECERLQGFPDGWTDIRPNGKDTPDSPRYKALGNSMAVPVMRWIGMRIAQSVQ